MSVRKSPPPPTSQQGALTKRARVDDDDQDNDDGGMTMTVASSGVAGGKGALIRSVKRTSGLAAPIVSLGGAHRVSPVGLAGVVDMCLLYLDVERLIILALKLYLNASCHNRSTFSDLDRARSSLASLTRRERGSQRPRQIDASVSPSELVLPTSLCLCSSSPGVCSDEIDILVLIVS